jgi:hypothetical protein
MANYLLQAQQKWAISPALNAGGYPGSPYFKITIAGTDRTLAATDDDDLVVLPAFTSFPFHTDLFILAEQIECWFSILSRQALRGASFTSPGQLRQAIDDFVTAYNQKAAPFEWKKAVVFSSGPKTKYSDLRN